jgi:hypothetical protein
VEAEAQRLLAAGRDDEALRILQGFVDENCRRVASEYQMLNETLPTMLKTVGIEYLYSDYVKEWTSRMGVPLPLR